jgi:hypothetical protein
MAERKSFLLRISPELWAELESWAGSELRSVNGQIEYLLRDAVLRRKRSAAASTAGPLPGSDSPAAGATEASSD